jgi:hypothetical protein
MKPYLQIDELNMRLPGRDAETGRRVAGGIPEALLKKLSEGIHRRIGAMEIRVPLQAGASESEMSHAVAEAIAKSLNKGDTAAGPGIMDDKE